MKTNEIIKLIELNYQIKALEKELKPLKEQLKKEMQENNQKEISQDNHIIKLIESVKLTTDYKQFVKDNNLSINPEKYETISNYYTLKIS